MYLDGDDDDFGDDGDDDSLGLLGRAGWAINERHIRQIAAWGPPGDTCNELINLIYRRLTEIQSQMRATLIVRPLAADTMAYTVLLHRVL